MFLRCLAADKRSLGLTTMSLDEDIDQYLNYFRAVTDGWRGMFSTVAPLRRDWQMGAVLALALLSVTGCSEQQAPEQFTVRIHQVHCIDGVESVDPPNCKGRSVDAGVLDYRLFPRERRALVRVVKQSPGGYTPSGLFELSDCTIWDAKNWECRRSHGGGFFAVYEVREGRFTYTMTGSTDWTWTNTGTVQVQDDSIFQWLLSR